ncbi:MAG: PilZ domain-containing protein [Candidatus Aminicenantes bacterium]|nr:PilZ domain-containing protein [Candidatus Aminicenantes bacterium]
MALKNCSECNGKISEKALLCPHCGFGLSQDLETLLLRLAAQAAAEAATTAAFEEKRRHRRLELRTMVQVDGEKALLFNISRSGLLLSTPCHPTGPDVDVVLDNGEQHCALKGTIRWVSRKRSFSNLVDFGVEIFEAPPAYYEFVDQLLANL